MQFNVSNSFFVHDGGTKYYRLYVIHAGNAKNGRSMTIRNWGKYSSAATKDRFAPRYTGQNKVTLFANVMNGTDDYAKEYNNRLKREYEHSSGREEKPDFRSIAELRYYLLQNGLSTEQINGADSHFAVLFAGAASPDKMTIIEAEQVEEVVAEPVVERGGDWGSW